MLTQNLVVCGICVLRAYSVSYCWGDMVAILVVCGICVLPVGRGRPPHLAWGGRNPCCVWNLCPTWCPFPLFSKRLTSRNPCCVWNLCPTSNLIYSIVAATRASQSLLCVESVSYQIWLFGVKITTHRGRNPCCVWNLCPTKNPQELFITEEQSQSLLCVESVSYAKSQVINGQKFIWVAILVVCGICVLLYWWCIT